MSEHTPTTNEVRADFIALHTRNFDAYATGRSLTSEEEYYGEGFDRWLERVKAEAWDEGYSASETTWKHIYDGHPVPEGEMCPECSTGNPYRKEQDR